MGTEQNTGRGDEDVTAPTPIYVSQLDACPSCGEDWLGPDIPEASRHLYGGKTHFSKVIGVYDTSRDRTAAWRCPACGQEWDRNAVASHIGRQFDGGPT